MQTMNWNKAIKQRVGNNKYPKLLRVKVGKGLMVYAALPLFSAWAFIPGLILTMPMSFSMWAKDKIRELKIKWQLI